MHTFLSLFLGPGPERLLPTWQRMLRSHVIGLQWRPTMCQTLGLGAVGKGVCMPCLYTWMPENSWERGVGANDAGRELMSWLLGENIPDGEDSLHTGPVEEGR